ncbi:unnamed protein product [Prorocentrum cordatum]|uniref:EF-hand domain-containing protein n=1 Tax=Prorocentrum cordatum TaxID=2364126 RepID=A0ABN9RWM7_9DINO|nr:unnamed protein product [Polarella glacialis]
MGKRAIKRPAAASAPKKRPASAFRPFPLRKRGKDKMGQRRKQAKKVEYVRHGKKTVKSRKERETWCRNYDSFHGKTADQMVDLLLEDGVLFGWEGRACPHCGVGTCGARVHDDNRGPHWRCNSGRLRGKTVNPCTAHPVFKSGGGCQSSSLSTKAKVLFCLTLGMTTAQIHLLAGANHKMMEDMSAAVAAARQIYVEKNEPNIVFGDEAQRRWFDVEADESVFRAQLSDDGRSKTWEQWAGVVERGRPDSLVLWKTQSDGTEANAPGPGAIKKTDWAPFLQSRLEKRKVTLHSDGARSYKMRASGLVHDHVVHCEKRKKIGRKWVWLKPVHSKVVTHKLPDGSKIRVKAGTQITDRAWRSIRTLIGTRTDLPGSRRIAASVRSAQFEYWNKGKDMWAATADAIWEVQPLGQVAYDAEGDGKLTFEEASLMVSGSKLDYHPSKCVKKLVAFADMASNYEGPIDFDKVHELRALGRFKDLQEPLSLKQEPVVPHTMQIFIVRQKPEDSECSAYRILKVVSFDKNRVDSATILKCARGEAHKIDYGKNVRAGSIAFQFMLEKLDGYQMRYFTIKPQRERKQPLEEDERAQGYTFIREHGPRSNNRNQFMEWADAGVNREGSKIFGWPASKVETALRNYQKGRTNAKPISRWSLTLKDFSGWFLNGVLRLMIGTLHTHGVMWVGKSRVGKSNGSKTPAWVHSAYSIQKKGTADEIAFLTVKHMDFFMGEPTTEILPGIFDDGLLQKVSADVLKAFLNPKKEDALLWARWGGCAFEQGSRRQAVANACDRDAEKAALDAATLNKHGLDLLKRIIAPSLEDVRTEEDFNAILARARVIAVTDLGVHWRVASANLQDGAEFMPWPSPRSPDLFVSEVRDATSPAIRPLPSDYAEKMARSIGCMSNVVAGLDVPTIATVHVAPIFGDGPARVVSAVGNVSGFVPGAASAPPAAAAASAFSQPPAELSQEEDAFGFGGGMDEPPEDSSRAASSAQPNIAGRCGELTTEDQDEQLAIFKSLAKAHHGAFEDLSSPPPVKRARGLMMGCGGPLSPVDADEQRAICASIAASTHGETIDVEDGDGLSAELARA